ncbi:MAG: hypothetical protein HQK50_00005, partial [Oligoflexia bacterium]|nr:hypothetical protein [Oligoflexia bacterium]
MGNEKRIKKKKRIIKVLASGNGAKEGKSRVSIVGPLLHSSLGGDKLVAYLAFLKKNFPELYHDQGIYHIDPALILIQNSSLLRKLKQIKGYSKKYQEKSKLLHLSVKHKKRTTVSMVHLDPLLLKKMGKRLYNAISFGETSLIQQIIFATTTKGKQSLLCDLVEAYVLIQDPDGYIPEGKKTVKYILDHIKEAHLDFFADHAILERKLASLDEILGRRKRGVIQELQKRMGKLADAAIAVKKQKKLHLELLECPPLLGMFRGHFGQDCSTLHSSAYALAPCEKI